jgi:excisionase family DNA binding protein
MEEKTIMTPYDVAAKTGLSLQLIYRELRKGTIPSVKCGDRYLISKEAFQRWLDDGYDINE